MGKCCGKCKQIKPVEEFSKNKAKFDGYNFWCKSCMRAYTKKHYQENKITYAEKNKRNKQEVAEYLWELKKSAKCYICGESHPATLDFHHVDASTKEVSISDSGWGLPKLLREIKNA